MEFEKLLPEEIEKRSFEIIRQELDAGGVRLDPLQAPIVMRCIHASADFDYAGNLCFSEDALERAYAALRSGADIVTDTRMAWSGINKTILARLGGEALCFMADEDVARTAGEEGITRAAASMRKAARLPGKQIFAIGNAPTALIELDRLVKEEKVRPALIIGVPVGFVNVVQAKELIMTAGIPYIVARGRKGGSNVAAAICNALLYEAAGRQI